MNTSTTPPTEPCSVVALMHCIMSNPLVSADNRPAASAMLRKIAPDQHPSPSIADIMSAVFGGPI